MNKLPIWLDGKFVYERVMIISYGKFAVLYESQWKVINSVIKDML